MLAAPGDRVVGYEANGGFLTRSDIVRDGRSLAALPTRDAVIVALGVLLLAAERDAGLRPGRPAAAAVHRQRPLKDFPTALSSARIARLSRAARPRSRRLSARLRPGGGLDDTDGLRITFASGEIVHLRPSGNAPELRCYTEAEAPGGPRR